MSIKYFKYELLELMREEQDIEKRDFYDLVNELVEYETLEEIKGFLNYLINEELLSLDDYKVEGYKAFLISEIEKLKR